MTYTHKNQLEERERMRRKREKEIRMRKKRMLRRMIIAGMILVVVAVFAGGCAIQRAIVQKKEAQIAAEKEAKKEAARKKEAQKTPEEKKAEELAKIKKQAEKDGCPPELIGLLDKNEELVDFVKDYPKKASIAPPETVGEIATEGGIPHFLQWDERWGYQSYGTSTIAASGCGPTCMSMVIVGLSGDTSATPYKMAKYSEEHGYIDETNNTYWVFMNEAAEDWGITSWETKLDESRLAQELQKGHPIICSMLPGDFTTTGHFIVLTGYQDGKVRVNDPFSVENTKKEWVFADIADQIQEMWVYSY